MVSNNKKRVVAVYPANSPASSIDMQFPDPHGPPPAMPTPENAYVYPSVPPMQTSGLDVRFDSPQLPMPLATTSPASNGGSPKKAAGRKLSTVMNEPTTRSTFTKRDTPKIVKFALDNEANAFDKIVEHIRINGEEEEDVVRDVFADVTNSEALISLAFSFIREQDMHYDAILKFKNDSKSDLVEPQLARTAFEKMMLSEGLYLEYDLSYDKKYTFIKIVAPFERLAEEAEKMNLKFKAANKKWNQVEEQRKPNSLLKRAVSLVAIDAGMTYDSHLAFRRSRLREFEGGDDRVTPFWKIRKEFFSPSKRNLIVHNIVTKIKFKCFEFQKRKWTLSYLLKHNIYTSFYAVHDGPHTGHFDIDSGQTTNCERSLLFRNWARFKNWKDRQPLDKVKDYFGEQIGFYFSWLGFYTLWLWIPAFFGLIVFIYGIILASSIPGYSGDSNGVRGYYKALYDDAAKTNGQAWVWLQAVFDNELTLPYAFIISLWTTLFLEFWKRKNNALACKWQVMNYEEEEDPRPEWEPSGVRVSAVTGKMELYFPRSRQILRMIATGSIITFFILVAIGALAGFIAFRAWAKDYFVTKHGENGNIAASILSALLSMVSILLLDFIYKRTTVYLNDKENHRQESSYQDALIGKNFLFDFINIYQALLWIGVLHPWFGSEDATGKLRPISLFGVEKWTDTCSGQSCMTDLFIQLAVVFLIKQFLQSGIEILTPFVRTLLNLVPIIWKNGRKFRKAVDEEFNRSTEDIAEKTLDMQMPGTRRHPQYMKDDLLSNFDINTVLRDNFSEMVVQFGFLVMFAVAFPLAPAFALVNNILEIRLDAYSFIVNFKRPFAKRAEDIGSWQGILNALGFIGVLTNAFIIAFSSSYFQGQIVKRYSNDLSPVAIRLAFVFAFEHLVIGIKMILQYMVPDIPGPVKVAVARERYMAKIALEGKKEDEDEEDPSEQDALKVKWCCC